MKSIWNKFKKFITENTDLVLAGVITYVIPLLLLSEKVGFIKEATTLQKLAIGGILIVIIAFIILYKKMKEYIIRLPKGITRGVLRIINSTFYWSIVFGAIYGIEHVVDDAKQLWIRVGVCFIIGHVFYMRDEIKKAKLNKHV